MPLTPASPLGPAFPGAFLGEAPRITLPRPSGRMSPVSGPSPRRLMVIIKAPQAKRPPTINDRFFFIPLLTQNFPQIPRAARQAARANGDPIPTCYFLDFRAQPG